MAVTPATDKEFHGLDQDDLLTDRFNIPSDNVIESMLSVSTVIVKGMLGL